MVYRRVFICISWFIFSAASPINLSQSTALTQDEIHEPTLILEVPIPDDDRLRSLVWSESGAMLAAAGRSAIYVWTLPDPQPSHILETQSVVDNTLQWTGESSLTFFTQNRDTTDHVSWDINTDYISLPKSITYLQGARAWNRSNGLVAGMLGNQTAIWNTAAFESYIVYIDTYGYSRSPLRDVVWSPENDLLVWLFAPERNIAGNIIVERFSDGEMVNIDPAPGSGSPACSSVAWSPDSETIACGQNDGDVLLLNVNAEWGDGLQALRQANGEIRDVKFSPDGEFVAAVDEHVFITVWSVATSQIVWRTATLHTYSYLLDWSPNSRQLAIGGNNSLIQIFEPEI
jgi:WD40 repeat protein